MNLTDLFNDMDARLEDKARSAPQDMLWSIMDSCQNADLSHVSPLDIMWAREACRAMSLGADPNLMVGGLFGRRGKPLDLAVSVGLPMLARALLAGGADAESAKRPWERALALAAEQACFPGDGAEDCAIALMRAGVDVVAPVEPDGSTIAMVAAKKWLPKLLIQAIESGGDLSAKAGGLGVLDVLMGDARGKVKGESTAERFGACWQALRPWVERQAETDDAFLQSLAKSARRLAPDSPGVFRDPALFHGWAADALSIVERSELLSGPQASAPGLGLRI